MSTCVSGRSWGDGRRAYLHLCLCDKHSSRVLMHQLFTFMTASSSLKYLLSIRPWEPEATSRRSTNSLTP